MKRSGVTFRNVDNVNIISNAGAIRRRVVISENVEVWSSANRNLRREVNETPYYRPVAITKTRSYDT